MPEVSEINNIDNYSKPTSNLRVWISDLTYTQQAISADPIPQAIGGIATYTEKCIDMSNPIRIFKYPEKLSEALEMDGPPDIIGFSNYIWNFNLSSEFAKLIKEIAPDTVTVFGGPNFPVIASEQEFFLRKHPEIDFYIIKEGELAFANLVKALSENGNKTDSIHGNFASIQSIDKNNDIHLTANIDRIKDLSEIPSPYVSGLMDEFFDGKLLPIIQTNRGCPFSCTFCVEGVKYYNKIYKNSQEKVKKEIEYIGQKMDEVRTLGGRNDLFIADSNFGMYKDDLETCSAIAKTQEQYNWPEYINVATGKNQKERVLSAAKLINGALRLSGSVQSLDPEVLDNIKRKNIAADDLMKIALEASDIGANSYCETILALPGDSKEKHFQTLKHAIEAGFNMVSTFQLMMLPGSEMCTKEARKKFGMKLRYRVFPRCYGYYDVCSKQVISAEIEEICVGLNTLSFDDYLECRKLHLIIAVFHNDGIFGTLLKYLKSNGLPVFRWLELISLEKLNGRIEEFFSNFINDTRNELWEDKEELENFIKQQGSIEKYINGELGNNLLFTYKTIAVTQYIDELCELANSSMMKLLEEESMKEHRSQAFIGDALKYHKLSMSNIFEDIEDLIEDDFLYDIKQYDNDIEPDNIDAYQLKSPIKYEFILEDKQKDLIRRYLDVFGNTSWGIGRMMTKVYVKRLLRKAIKEGERELDESKMSLLINNINDDPSRPVAGGTKKN